MLMAAGMQALTLGGDRGSAGDGGSASDGGSAGGGESAGDGGRSGSGGSAGGDGVRIPPYILQSGCASDVT